MMSGNQNLVCGAGGGGKSGGGGSARVAQEDPDSLRSRQYARVLDAICEGEIVGLVNGAQSVYLDDTPLQNADGSYNFHDVSVVTANGLQSQSYLPGYSDVESEVSVGVEITVPSPVTRSITNPNLDRVRLTLGFPQLTQQDTTTGDLHGTSVTISIQLQTWVRDPMTEVSYPGGFVSFPLDHQWVGCGPDNSGANSYGIGCAIAWTNGSTSYQDGEGNYYEQDLWVSAIIEYKLVSSGTWLTLKTVDLPPPSSSFLRRGTPAPSVASYFTSQLGIGPYQIRVRNLSGSGSVFLTSAMSYSLADTATISGKTTNRYQRSFTLPLPKPVNVSGWDIRVVRNTPDSTSAALVNETWLDSYTEVIDVKLGYPNTALVGISIDASQFRAIPRRAYDVKLLKIKVPINYDPETRVYTGVWNGTFKTAWSDNPAWCFYDLLTNPRYGLGEFISAEQVDKWALYNIAQYCDELVPNGFGGTEPRFTCNLYLQTREEAYKVINDMASIFRSMVYWASGAIFASQDRPSDPVALFTPANVIDGLFHYEGSSRRARHTVALISWNDPADRYRQKIEYVEDVDGISRYGVVQTDVAAIGCTSRGQAHRMGKWILYSGSMETETVTFDIGLFDVRKIYPGAVIKTADAARAGKRWGGRIMAATAVAITVDALTDGSTNSITIEAAKTYTLSVVLPDGTVATSTVTNAPGSNVAVLTVGPAYSAAPQQHAIWVLEESSLVAQTGRVISITETAKATAKVVALEHNPSKFAAVEQGLALQSLPVSTINATTQAPVTNITTTESLYIVKGDIKVRLHVGWDAPALAMRYLVEFRLESGNWQSLPEATSQSAELLNIANGNYTLRVTAISHIGVRSTPTVVALYVAGKTAPPPDVGVFLVSAQADGTRQFTWVLTNPPLDLSGFRIRYKLGTGATWIDMTPLHDDLLVSSPYETNRLAKGAYTFAIKAVDTSGNESLNAQYIDLTIPDPRLAGVLDIIDAYAGGWPGTKTSCHVEVETGYLKASDTTTWATLPATWADWTRWCLTPISPIVYEETIDIGVVANFTPLISVTADGTPTITESHSDDGFTWTAYAATGMLLTCRYVKIRIAVAGAYPVLKSAVTILDAKPVTEDINDLNTATLTGAHRIGVGDIRLPISKSYATVRRVQVALQSVGAWWTWVLVDKDTTVGPRIQIYNGSGVLADANIDATIGGL